MSMIAFLPCRAGSQRVPQKNTRPFADEENGLLGIKLRQLLATPEIDEVVLSTNDPLVIEVGERFLPEVGARMRIDHRPDHLCTSTTSTDDLVGYVPSIIPSGDVLWTHVTSPFFDTKEYSAAIQAYHSDIASGVHDSLMGVLELHTFLWSADGPVNYDRAVEKWPRTQTLPPFFEVNSSIFIANTDIYRKRSDRIGTHPRLHAVPKSKSMDIDWEEDFYLAAEIWKLRQ